MSLRCCERLPVQVITLRARATLGRDCNALRIKARERNSARACHLEWHVEAAWLRQLRHCSWAATSAQEFRSALVACDRATDSACGEASDSADDSAECP